MKISLIVVIFSFVLSCSSTQKKSDSQSETTQRSTSIDPVENLVKEPSKVDLLSDFGKVYAESIIQEDLKEVLYTLASDAYEGRFTGEPGQKKAAQFIANYYKGLGISATNSEGNYLQEIPEPYFKGSAKSSSENVVAYIKGTEKPDEYVVISAHYDHVGVKGGKVYNGADDDASGTTAVLEIAKAFQKAVKTGNGPKRSVVFLHVTGEEIGLYGSKYYTENPIFPLENTIVDLNMDMIGRIDEKHKETPEFVYLIGADKLSTELHEISEAVNEKYTKLALDYTYNDEKDPNRFYYRSDHYNFAKNNIPVIFYFNGVHEDYHKDTDTPDKIRYDLLQKRAQLVFYTAWEIANRDKKLEVDKE
ncbi:M28 family metallopeptidase [Aureibaculum luteum]|uniref:M28 family metallopeptidase n=1 Tax=Aureibaculum luteum TaxID=1548456 RepID=UPI000E4A1FB4|nr:M28 family metallopeptidase [Aureibaculum luteum]